jgi:hypothetical protein
MKESAGSKSESFIKSQGMTMADKLALGEPPTVHLGMWLGRDPRDGEVYADCYVENEFESYHDWPYRVEGVVFHDLKAAREFAWSLSKNQGYRDVWLQTPTGFPDPTNWWCEERMERDGEWTEQGRIAMEKAKSDRGTDSRNDTKEVPTQDIGIDPPARAETEGRRKAYWDGKRTVITDEFHEDSISPNRKLQQEQAKRQR